MIERDPDRSLLARIGPALLLALLLGATALATVLMFHRVEALETDARAGQARSVANAIDERMREASRLLVGAAALSGAHVRATPREFRDFLVAQDVTGHFPGTLGIIHASLVDRRDAGAYERRTRRVIAASGLGYPRFRIHPAPRPGQRRLLVVDRVVPVARESRAFGLDLMSTKERRATALRALRTGQPAAGPPLEPLRFRGPGLAVMLMAPVAAPGGGGAPRGVVYGTFRMDLLMRGVVGRLADGASAELYDIGPATIAGAGPAAPFRVSGARSVPLRDDEDTDVQTLSVGGRRWALAYRQPDVQLAALDRAGPWLVLVSGVLVSLLAVALLRVLRSSRARAIRLAEEMTLELREREAELQVSHAELEHFAYLASHDLQEPLRTITSYAGLLQRRSAEQLDERSLTWLRFISEGAARMSDLIADLLEYSRTGRARGEPEPTSLERSWDAAVANLAEAIERNGATVTRGPLPTVEARPPEMLSLLQNLVANALKYRGDTPPNVHAEAVRRDDHWEVRVRDNGIGIHPQFHDRVFGLFQRLHTADEYPGTGMGLAIVRKIAEANGGGVRVESEPGDGATFIIDLPAPHETTTT